jgi:hypothetical protein
METKLKEYVSKTVLLNVTEAFARENEPLIQSGSTAQLLYAKIVAVDGMGLWVENPSWKARPARGGDAEAHTAHILIPWGVLISVAAFPERQFSKDEPLDEKQARVIGFASGREHC